MPLTLFWYIFRDLVRVMLTSTLVLVTVISFGAAIRPLGDGIVGPFALFRFIVLAMPPMLQFAVPFAAAFSATVVYHRMTSDNEIAACAASGVSYPQMLLPAATLGLALTIFLSFLANYISPQFWGAMERAARLDAPEYFIRSIQRGEPVRAGNSLIYANRIQRVDVDGESDAYAALRLEGIIVAAITKGDFEYDMTARQGVFKLTRQSNMTVITAVLEEAIVYDAEKKGIVRSEGVTSREVALPDTFKDTPKFMDIKRLKKIAAEPTEYWRVANVVNDLRRHLAHRWLFRSLEQELAASGVLALVRRVPDPRDPAASLEQTFVIHASKIELDRGTWMVVPPNDGNDPIRITVEQEGRPIREYLAGSLMIDPKIKILPNEPTMELRLSDVQSRDLRRPGSGPSARAEILEPDLRLNVPLVAELRDMTTQELGELAVRLNEQESIAPLARSLTREEAKLHNLILSRLHERVAQSVSCVVMMLLGAVLAIRLKQSLPLTVYFWSFIPSIGGLILISAGTDLVKDADVAQVWGLIVMWSGNLAMALYVLMVLRTVTRN